jgi:hypothetical protein
MTERTISADRVLSDPDVARSPFLLKVFLGRRMSRDALVAHIERRRADAQTALDEYQSIEERIRGSERDSYGYMTLRWGLAHQQAWVEWADEILAELAERKP